MTPSSTLNQVPLLQWHRIAAQGAGHPRLQELGFLPLENVRVLQRSWLPGGALVNRSQFRKFGLKVAELVATIRPAT